MYIKTQNILREVYFYGLVRIIHVGSYFRCFIAFEKLKYYARFKVYAIKLKTKTKDSDYFSKLCFEISIFDKRQVKVSTKNTKELREVAKEIIGEHLR